MEKPVPVDIPDCGDDFAMISALQHFLFCKRQCALIHLEGVWAENWLTATGRVMHERVDTRASETRRDLRQATALRIFSRRLRIAGVARAYADARLRWDRSLVQSCEPEDVEAIRALFARRNPPDAVIGSNDATCAALILSPPLKHLE